jgi:hypothetical protein
VAKFKYLGTIPTDKNCMYSYEEIKTRLNSRNACYHSFKSLLLSSRLLFRNVWVKIHRIILLSVVLYGCETWSLTLREEHRLKMFENKVLRRISGPKGDEVTGEWRSFLFCTHPQISLGRSSRGECGGRGMWHAWERREVYKVLLGKSTFQKWK